MRDTRTGSFPFSLLLSPRRLPENWWKPGVWSDDLESTVTHRWTRRWSSFILTWRLGSGAKPESHYHGDSSVCYKAGFLYFITGVWQEDYSVMSFKYAPLISSSEPHSASLGRVSFLIVPMGSTGAVVRCRLLFCLLHLTPVEPFGISRLYLILFYSSTLHRHISGRLQHLQRHSVQEMSSVYGGMKVSVEVYVQQTWTGCNRCIFIIYDTGNKQPHSNWDVSLAQQQIIKKCTNLFWFSWLTWDNPLHLFDV